MTRGRLLLVLGVALLTLSAGGAAEARRRPPVVYDMVLGQPTPSPIGYYEFCQREPADCFTPEEIAAAQALGAASALNEPEISPAAQPPRSNYWSLAFRGADAQRHPAYRGRVSLAGPPAALRAPSPRFVPPQTSRRLLGKLGAFPPELDDAGRIVLTRDVRRTLKRVNRKVNRGVIPVSDRINYGQLDVWNLPLSRNARGWGDCEDYAVEKRHQLLEAGYPMNQLSLALVRTRWGDTHAVLLVETTEGALALDSFSGWVVPWWKLDYQWLMRQSVRDPSLWVRVLGEGWANVEAPPPG